MKVSPLERNFRDSKVDMLLIRDISKDNEVRDLQRTWRLGNQNMGVHLAPVLDIFGPRREQDPSMQCL